MISFTIELFSFKLRIHSHFMEEENLRTEALVGQQSSKGRYISLNRILYNSIMIK